MTIHDIVGSSLLLQQVLQYQKSVCILASFHRYTRRLRPACCGKSKVRFGESMEVNGNRSERTWNGATMIISDHILPLMGRNDFNGFFTDGIRGKFTRSR
jgi:hypothetical protein